MLRDEGITPCIPPTQNRNQPVSKRLYLSTILQAATVIFWFLEKPAGP